MDKNTPVDKYIDKKTNVCYNYKIPFLLKIPIFSRILNKITYLDSTKDNIKNH